MIPKSTKHLSRLRNFFTDSKYVKEPIYAYIIPMCDAHQSEYIAPCHQRLEYLTGFTGSAGTAIVTVDKAALWTDGRYHIQASQQLDENWILMKDGFPDTPNQAHWLSIACPLGSKIGIDPYMISCDMWTNLSKALKLNGQSLEPLSKNLIDEIWNDQPAFPLTPVQPLEIEFTGKTWMDKVADLRTKMQKNGSTCLIVTDLAEIAWLLNLRGSDIAYNPVFFAYVVVTMKDLFLFIEEEKITPQVSTHLQLDSGAVTIQPYNQIKYCLSSLDNVNVEKGKIWLSSTSSYALSKALPEDARTISSLSPIQVMKAIKNPVEIKGTKECHIRDGIALCQYFNWLEENIASGNVTEISGADVLENFRREQPNFMGLSFPTISSSGPNGAIIHYKPTKETDRPILQNEIYLCDSGGQYKNGTTDITRTWHFGSPTLYERKAYTHVLKGHIALASTVFPTGTQGNRLDVIARMSLWSDGLNYVHGTGHGVGSYLNVHEGPIGIHFKEMKHDPGIEKDMVITIEPGYYEKGKFGIRLENVFVITTADTPYNFHGKGSLTFEPISLHPIQTTFLETELLNEKEIKWLNDYHQLCRENLGPILLKEGKTSVYQWLMRKTVPLA